VDSSLSLAWETPVQVNAGEQFPAILRVSSRLALRSLPLVIGFDPQLLQVAGVAEGDYFKQGDGRTNFSYRVDVAQGKIFVTALRPGTSEANVGGPAAGAVATVTFKALTGGTAPRIQLLSALPEPPPDSPVAVPIQQTVRVVP